MTDYKVLWDNYVKTYCIPVTSQHYELRFFRLRFINHLKADKINKIEVDETQITAKMLLHQLQISYPNSSRKFIYLRYRNSEDVLSLQDFVKNVLIQKEVWYSVWGSTDMLCIPTAIRHDLLQWGVENNPTEIKIPATLYKFEKITPFQYSYVGTSSSLSSEIHQTSTSLTTTDCDTSVLLVNLNNCNNQQKYNQSIDMVRNFLSATTVPKGTITKLPVHLKTAAARKNQTANYWLPALEHVYGSLEEFLFCLSRTESGKNALMDLISSGNINNLLKNQINKQLQDHVVRKWRDTAQVNYNTTGSRIAKGLNVSTSTFQNIHNMTVLEPKEDAQLRAKKRTNKALPKRLQNINTLESYLIKAVSDAGGGWNVKWSSQSWISSWLPQFPDESMMEEDKNKSVLATTSWIKSKMKTTNLGTHFIQIYVNSFDQYKTPTILQHLEEKALDISCWRSRSDPLAWERFVNAHSDFWHPIPDASFLAFKW